MDLIDLVKLHWPDFSFFFAEVNNSHFEEQMASFIDVFPMG